MSPIKAVDPIRDREIYDLASVGYSRDYICIYIARTYNIRRLTAEQLYDKLIHRDMRNVLVEKNPFIQTHEEVARHEIIMCQDAIAIAETMLHKNYELWQSVSDLVVELFELKKQRALSDDAQESIDLNSKIVRVQELLNEYSAHLPTLEASIFRNLDAFRRERRLYAKIHGLSSAVDWRQAIAILIKKNMLPAQFASRLHSAMSKFDTAVALADDMEGTKSNEQIGGSTPA